MLLQLPHEALSNFWLLIMWHIPNLMLQVAPKKKIAHRQVRRTRGPRPITTFTHQSARKLSPKISHYETNNYTYDKLVAVVKISLIGRLLLILANFENVHLYSNPNISEKTVKWARGCCVHVFLVVIKYRVAPKKVLLFDSV